MVDASILDAMSGMTRNPGAAEDQLERMLFATKADLPGEYLDLLRYANGAEGTVGKDGKYVHLCSTSEIPRDNSLYQVKSLHPDVLIIGGDGGGEAFCLDFRTTEDQPSYIMAPLIGWLADAVPVGATLKEFFDFLQEDW